METRTRARLGEVLSVTVDPGVPVDYPDSQFEEPDVAAAQLLRNKKNTSDAKWTELMMQKLATTIFLAKSIHENLCEDGGQICSSQGGSSC